MHLKALTYALLLSAFTRTGSPASIKEKTANNGV